MGLAAPAGRGRPGRQRLHAGCATSSRRVGWGVRGHVAQWRPQTRELLGCGGIELRPFPTHTCFRRLRIDGQLELGRQLRVSLDPGERKQFSIAVVNGGPYRIRVEDRQYPPESELTTTSTLPITPVMYLYQLGSGIVDPVAASATLSLPFIYEDEGTYYLEVEELLRDPVEFTLTVVQ